jgi:MFS family permease
MKHKGGVRLGLRENAPQFALLVVLNAFVGAMVGLERSTLPLVGEEDFGLSSSAAVLSFIVAFGAAKAFTNLAAGSLATSVGRRRLLVIGWLFALPVPLLIGVAPSWAVVVAANALLGVNQGLAWSMTVVMKIDLVGPRRRGLALGLNEAAGYGGVAVAAVLSGWLAADLAARDVLVGARRLSPSPACSSPRSSFATQQRTSSSSNATRVAYPTRTPRRCVRPLPPPPGGPGRFARTRRPGS